MHTRFSLLVLAVTPGCAALHAQQYTLIGTCKLNLAKSKYDPASEGPKMPGILNREATAGGGMKNTNEGHDTQGNLTHSENSYKYDGKDYPITGSQEFDMRSFRRIDANTVVNVSKQNGVVMQMNRSIISKYGNTNTIDSIGINPQGVAYHNVLVYDKQ